MEQPKYKFGEQLYAIRNGELIKGKMQSVYLSKAGYHCDIELDDDEIWGGYESNLFDNKVDAVVYGFKKLMKEETITNEEWRQIKELL